MIKVLKSGFIKLYRSLLDWEWYDDIPTKTLFIHLILTVNINDSNWHGVEIKRGGRVASIETFSKETGLTNQQIRTAIKHLESTGELTRYKHPKFTVFLVNNYDKFQEVTEYSQPTNNLPTTNPQQNKNTKKLKEEKEDVRTIPDEKTAQIFQLFNSICKSYEPVIHTNVIAKRIDELLQQYSIEQFKAMFEKAESSAYLKGINCYNWKANFEWMLKDDKFAKILSGSYDDWQTNKSNNDTVNNSIPENKENIAINAQIEELMAMSTISNIN